MRKGSELYCWFDTEYTSLEVEQAELLQVALVVTDHALAPIPPPPDLALPEGTRTPIGVSACLALPAGYEPGAWAREHLAGVLTRCAESRLDAEAIDAVLYAILERLAGPPANDPTDRPVLAGSSLHHDWFLARRDLPLFSASLSYRLLDVTALKLQVRHHFRPEDPPALDKEDPRAVRRYFPQLCGPETLHDAHFDAQASAAELALYRSILRAT